MLPAGHGALKGQYAVRTGVDVTKPVFEQVRRASRGERAPKKKPGKDRPIRPASTFGRPSEPMTRRMVWWDSAAAPPETAGPFPPSAMLSTRG